MSMLWLTVGLEIVLVLCCIFGIYYILSKKPIDPLLQIRLKFCWILGYVCVGIAASLGALYFSGQKFIKPYHTLVTHWSGMIVPVAFMLASLSSLGVRFINHITSAICVVGSVGVLIASHTLPLANKKALEILATIIVVTPAACLTLMLMLCSLAIFGGSGLRKFKAQWLLWAIVFFTVSDMILKRKKTFWILQPEDIYHGLLSMALLVLTQVASPKISKEELDSFLHKDKRE